MTRWPRWGCAALVCAVNACGSSAFGVASRDTAVATQAATAPTRSIDVATLLALDAAVAPANVEAHGTCIATDAEHRSRVIYLWLPAELSYARFAVAAPQRAPEMIDLVRGIPDGRIWSATYEKSRGSATARLFASASDKSPVTETWPEGDPRLQQLRKLATTAIQAPCTTQ